MKDESIGNKSWMGSYGGAGYSWLQSCNIKFYLIEKYYVSLTENAQHQIVTSNFSTGAINRDDNLANQINDENSQTWYGKIALSTVSEYIRSNSNKISCGTYSLNNDNYSTCRNTTWMYNGDEWWTLTQLTNYSNYTFVVRSDKIASTQLMWDTSEAVRPVVCLSSSVKITGGDGSQSNQFQLSL